jgi:hypothetical protein
MGQQGAYQVCSSTTAFLLAIALAVTFHGDKTLTQHSKYRIKKNISIKLLFFMVLTS